MARGVELFSALDGCGPYKAIRQRNDFADIKEECERLWEKYRTVAESQFPARFANNFHEAFWEMYVFDMFGDRCQRTKSGPDFVVDGEIYLEATVAGPGSGKDEVSIPIPADSESEEISYLPAFDRTILRITNSFNSKAKHSNGIVRIGKKHPVVIAVNLPYPQANDCNIGGGLGVRALFGYSQDLFVSRKGGLFEPILSKSPTVNKANGSPVYANALLRQENSHISAVVLGSVTPFSSTYKCPPFELVHNPHATYPVPRGWLGCGQEFWIESESLHQISN